MNLTDGESVVPLSNAQQIPVCSIEEADAWIIVHLRDAVNHGFSNIIVCTVDSNVIAIIIGHKVLNVTSMALAPPEKVWISFPVIHAFTGCNTVSFFSKKGEKTFWKRILAFPDVIEAFYFIAINPFTEVTVDNDVFKLLEQLVNS